MKKVKTLWDKIMEDKLKSAIIIAVALSLTASIMAWTKKRAVDLIDAPENIQELQEDVNDLQERVKRLERIIRPVYQKRK